MLPGRRREGSGHRCLACHSGREPVTALRHGLDIANALLFKQLPKAEDAFGQVPLFNRHVRPHRLQQRVLFHEPAGTCDEGDEQVELLGCERDGRAVAFQRAVGYVEHEGTEPVDRARSFRHGEEFYKKIPDGRKDSPGRIGIFNAMLNDARALTSHTTSDGRPTLVTIVAATLTTQPFSH